MTSHFPLRQQAWRRDNYGGVKDRWTGADRNESVRLA
jgi:hypothetical protein